MFSTRREFILSVAMFFIKLNAFSASAELSATTFMIFLASLMLYLPLLSAQFQKATTKFDVHVVSYVLALAEWL
jgi:hypothetical protein